MHSIYLIFILLLVTLDNIWCEWIEMPQFSDDARIYRIPVTIHNSYKNNEKKVSSFSQDKQNVSGKHDKLGIDYEIETNVKNYSMRRMPISSASSSMKHTSNITVDKAVDMSSSEESLIAILKNTILHSNATTGNIIVVNETDPALPKAKSGTSNNFSTMKTKYLCSTNILPQNIMPHQMTITQNVQGNVLTDREMFWDNLPVEILGIVHNKLRLQSMDMNKKMMFLKAFETILTNAIESRFATIFAHARKVRGISEHDHNYDEHDDHGVGFPSVEGALMAISFLTFAVYLVRLVMLLFQNMNSSVATPTTATLFLGKRKRSVDNISYGTLRLLIHTENFTIKP